MIFVNLFPNYLALKQTSEGMSFTGQASWFDPWDINVYVSVIRWGQHHGILMENTYSSMPNQAILQYPIYSLMGSLFKNANPFLLFHLSAAVITIILVTVLVLIAKRIFSNNVEALISVLIACVGGGFGFLILLGQDSIDATMTAITLHSAFQRAHEGIALAAFMVALFSFHFSVVERKNNWHFVTYSSLFIAIISYPQNIASFALITAIYIWTRNNKISWKNLEWRFWFVSVLVGVSTAAAMTLNLSNNSSLGGVMKMQLTHPSPGSFVFGYGIMFLLFTYQFFYIKPKSEIQRFLTIWVLSCVMLSLIPVGFSRFFLRGLYVPLALLAVLTIKYLSSHFFAKEYQIAKNTMLMSLAILVSTTSLFIFTERIVEIKEENPWYYMTNSQRATLNFIRDELPADSTILTDYYMGNQVPANTNSRVYFGHLLQTPNATDKQEKIDQFYTGEMSGEDAKKFLTENNIQYVYADREELEVSYAFLEQEYANDEVFLYGFEGK